MNPEDGTNTPDEPTKRSGFEHVHVPPNVGKVVSMFVWRDRAYVACEYGVFFIENGELTPIKFEADSDSR